MTYPATIDDDTTLYQVEDLAEALLTEDVLTTDDEITVTSTASFPPTGFLRINLGSGTFELVEYTGKTSTTFTVIRGIHPNHPAAEFDAGVKVGLVVMAAHHNAPKNAIIAIQEALGVNPQGAAVTVVERLEDIEAAATTSSAALAAETAARIAADGVLQDNIDQEVSDRDTAVNGEATTRAAADTTLQTNINSEASTRASADTTLQTNIDSEASTRASADTTLQANIDAEASTRASADTALQSNIDAEASTRADADDTLQDNIDAEVAARIADVDAEETARIADVDAEESARIAADAAHVAASDPHPQYVQESREGVAGGIATLDGGGKVPVTQLPNSIMQYVSGWNATTNSPALADGAGNADDDVGDVYRVTVAGTQDLGSGSITFNVGDYVILNYDKVWEKSDTTDAVSSVEGRTGAVSVSDLYVDFLSDQSITGAKTFADSKLKLANTSTGILTFQYAATSSNLTAIIPNASGTATFAMLNLTQTFTGAKTFQGSSGISLTAAPTTNPIGDGATDFISAFRISTGTTDFVTTPQTANFYTFSLGNTTLTNPSSGTIPRAATLRIVGAPLASTNVTITDSYSLVTEAGAVKFVRTSAGATTVPLVLANHSSSTNAAVLLRFGTTGSTNIGGTTTTASVADIKARRPDATGGCGFEFVTTSISTNPGITAMVVDRHNPVGSSSAFASNILRPAQTMNFATSAQTGNYYGASVEQMTLVGAASGTIPVAASLYIDGPPVASTNVTITNAYALWVAGGQSRLDGRVLINKTAVTQDEILGINPTASVVGSGSVSVPGIRIPTAQTVAYTGATAQTGDVYVTNLGQTILTNATAGTVANAATFRISDTPAAGSGMTITNSYAFWVAGGTSRFDGSVVFKNAGAGTNPSISSNSSTQTAQFTGNFNPATDTSFHLGFSSSRWNTVNVSTAVRAYTTNTDTQPIAELGTGGLKLGAGGSTATSITLSHFNTGQALLETDNPGSLFVLRRTTSGATTNALMSFQTSTTTRWNIGQFNMNSTSGFRIEQGGGGSGTGHFIAATGFTGINDTNPSHLLTVAGAVKTTLDVIVDDATKGLVLKDTQGTPHYWRVTVNNSGVLVITDVGTTRP